MPRNQCEDLDLGLELTAADEASCSNEEDTCCSDITDPDPDPDPDDMCSAIDGYSCAPPRYCTSSEISENNLASCSEFDITRFGYRDYSPPGVVLVCCANQDVIRR